MATYIKKGSVIVAGKKKIVYKKKGSTKSYVIYKKRYMNLVKYKKLKSIKKPVKKPVKKIKGGGWPTSRSKINPEIPFNEKLVILIDDIIFNNTYTNKDYDILNIISTEFNKYYPLKIMSEGEKNRYVVAMCKHFLSLSYKYTREEFLSLFKQIFKFI